MLLRNISKHVKDQNWFAVALDFFIVVFGVFIGLQVQNWNEVRRNNDRAVSFLVRIGGDVDADIATYTEQAAFWRQVSAYGTSALSYTKTNDAKGANQWELLLSFFQASQLGNFITRDTTYEELKSAGELALIDNIKLRDQLASYYTNANNPALGTLPRYREHIRGLIPFDIQQYIWESCYRSVDGVGQEMFACDSPINEEQAGKILGELTDNKKLIEELRFWMSTMHVASIIAHDRTVLATQVRKAIDYEISNEPLP